MLSCNYPIAKNFMLGAVNAMLRSKILDEKTATLLYTIYLPSYCEIYEVAMSLYTKKYNNSTNQRCLSVPNAMRIPRTKSKLLVEDTSRILFLPPT